MPWIRLSLSVEYIFEKDEFFPTPFSWSIQYVAYLTDFSPVNNPTELWDNQSPANVHDVRSYGWTNDECLRFVVDSEWNESRDHFWTSRENNGLDCPGH